MAYKAHKDATIKNEFYNNYKIFRIKSKPYMINNFACIGLLNPFPKEEKLDLTKTFVKGNN